MSIAQLDNQLCFALYSASNMFTSIYRPLLEPLDLTYTQFIVLMALWEQDNVTITYLAERTGLSKPTMTPLLRRLEAKKLILRKVPPDNERKKNVVLTRAGRRLSSKSKVLTEKALNATGLTKRQGSELMQGCRKLIENGSEW